MTKTQLHRREAKAARRRHRKAIGKSPHRLTAPQEAARADIGERNLHALMDRAEVVAENERREGRGRKAKRLPLLTHHRGRIPRSVLEDLGHIAPQKKARRAA